MSVPTLGESGQGAAKTKGAIATRYGKVVKSPASTTSTSDRIRRSANDQALSVAASRTSPDSDQPIPSRRLHTSRSTTTQRTRRLRPRASDYRALSHLNWDSPSLCLAEVLRSLQDRTPAYVHPRPISFATLANKKSLAPHLDSPNETCLLQNDTFTEFWSRTGTTGARPLNGIALFLTHCCSRVAKADWKKDWWHCWGVALLKKDQGYGKVLIIYDCDTDDSRDFDGLQPSRLLLSTQCRLIKIAQEQGRVDSVWVGNGGLKPQKKWACVFNTMQWIQQSTSGLDVPFKGPDDERLCGFHHIPRL